MRTADKDVLDLLDHAWERLWNRMAGLTDREWSWRPDDADDRITIRWRLFHIAEVLTQSRNWTWLAVTPPEAKIDRGGADSAQDALASMDLAYAGFRELVTSESVDLGTAIGPAAGPHGSATRRTYVLRIADELIHHAPRPRSCAIFTPAVRLTDDPNWSAVIQIRRPEMAEIALPQSRDDIQDDDQRIVQIDHRTHLHEKGTGGGYSLARGSGTRTAGEYAGDRVVVGASCSAAGVSDSRTRFRVPAGARRRTHVEAKLKASLSGHRSGRSSGERFPPKRLPRRNAPGGAGSALS